MRALDCVATYLAGSLASVGAIPVYKNTKGYWWLRPLYSVGRDWVPKVLWRLLARLSQNVVKVARLFQSVVYLRECVARAILWKTGVRCQHSSCFTVVLTTMKEKRTIIYPSTPTFLTMCTGSPNKVWPGVGRLQSCSAFCIHRLYIMQKSFDRPFRYLMIVDWWLYFKYL